MRKFIFNGSMISAVFGGIRLIGSTRQSPRDWRTALLWVGWATTLAIAIGTVIIDANQAELEEE